VCGEEVTGEWVEGHFAQRHSREAFAAAMEVECVEQNRNIPLIIDTEDFLGSSAEEGIDQEREVARNKPKVQQQRFGGSCRGAGSINNRPGDTSIQEEDVKKPETKDRSEANKSSYDIPTIKLKKIIKAHKSVKKNVEENYKKLRTGKLTVGEVENVNGSWMVTLSRDVTGIAACSSGTHIKGAMLLPMSGLIIGKNGKKIMALRKETGAALEVEGDEFLTTVKCSGPKESVMKAKGKIEEILKSDDKFQMPIPKSNVDDVISARWEIMNKSGVRNIWVQPRGEVEIRGSEEKVKVAVRVIRQMLQM
jgi:hypothetical protein